MHLLRLGLARCFSVTMVSRGPWRLRRYSRGARRCGCGCWCRKGSSLALYATGAIAWVRSAVISSCHVYGCHRRRASARFHTTVTRASSWAAMSAVSELEDPFLIRDQDATAKRCARPRNSSVSRQWFKFPISGMSTASDKTGPPIPACLRPWERCAVDHFGLPKPSGSLRSQRPPSRRQSPLPAPATTTGGTRHGLRTPTSPASGSRHARRSSDRTRLLCTCHSRTRSTPCARRPWHPAP